MPAHKKDDSVRRRTNPTQAGKIVLPPRKGRKSVPALPTNIKWYPQVRDWWKRSWSSPMALMWAEPDRDSMFLAARLRQQFWDPETTASSRNQTSAQIRALDDSLGLTPLGRHRMGWVLGDDDDSGETTTRRTPARNTAVSPIDDPRKRRRLAAVK